MENTIEVEKQLKAFPPVPNWYSNYTTSITNCYYVYASKSLLIILILPFFEYKTAFTASLDKINAIDTHSHFCYVSGVDPIIRVWNLLDGAQLTSFHIHKTEVTVLKCIRDGSVIISGDKSGLIVVQEAFGVKRQQKQPIKSEITALAVTHYQNIDYVAVGYQNGMIVIYTVDTKLDLNQICQLSHPNDCINALAWKPISKSDNNNDNDTQQPLYLASSAKRMKTVIVWSVLDALSYCTIKLPNPSARFTNQQKTMVWITLAWSPINKDYLYVTTYVGEIICYNIHNNRGTVVKKPKFEEAHNRIIFNICTYNNNIITTSLDKQIIKWNPREGKKMITIKTQSGFPYSIDISPLNPIQSAIAYGDNSIKIWKCAQLNESQLTTNSKKRVKENIYESNTFWRGLQGQVKCVRWSPTKEGILAFSTEYGHIGIYDTYENKSWTFRNHHSSTTEGSVPFITWIGDLSTLISDDVMEVIFNINTSIEPQHLTNVLVSCDSKHLFLRDANNQNSNSIDLNEILQQRNQEWYVLLESKNITRTCVSANVFGNLLALGNDDGSIEIYHLKTLKIIFASNSLRLPITTMDWKDNGEYSLLAAGCKSGLITIYKIEKDELNKPCIIPTIQPLYYSLLKGHKGPITDVKWSHHMDIFLLASTSVDNLAIVWEVEKEESSKIVSCFDKHHSAVLSVSWQYLDPDILLTGGEDRFVYLWNWKGYPLVGRDIENTVPLLQREKKRLLRKKPMKSESTEKSNKRRELEDSNDDNTDDTINKKKKKNTYQTTSLFNETLKSLKSHQQVKLQQKCFQSAVTMQRKDSALIIDHIKNQLENRDDDDEIINKYSTISTIDDTDMEDEKYLNLLFGDKNDIRKLIGLEVDSLVDTNEKKIDMVPTNNALFGADMKLALDIMRSEYFTLESYKYAGDGMMLTDWIVLALSPIAGKQTWLKLMEEQANKLLSGKYYHLAATCFIGCSKIYEAVDVYRQVSMYKEALAIAKLRLSSDELLVSNLLSEWASHLQSKGEDELAALCYIQSQLPGSVLNAIHLLGRRDTESSFFWSACLASIIDDNSACIWTEKWKDSVTKRKAQQPKTTQ
ncbi:unnamed protein product [Cunninghamella blakesleeana]